MKIVADSKIPGITQFLSSECELELLPLEDITSITLRNADVLIGRSVLKVNKALLENTNVQVVGTCSSGTDHIDTNYLNEKGITLFSAPGSNAQGVADYVLWMLAFCEKNNINVCSSKRAGIIGAGYVGTKVRFVLETLGFNVIVNDPPKAAKDFSFDSATLAEIAECDLICVHSALTKTGDYPSYHLLSEDWWSLVKEKTVVINAARGAVIDTNALLKQKKALHLCLDVFENEPDINEDLLRRCMVATPHIAGHTIESFYRATQMIVEKVHGYFGLKNHAINAALPYKDNPQIDAHDCKHWYDVILKCYNFFPKLDLMPNSFYTVRNTYRDRHDFGAMQIKNTHFLSELDRCLLKKLQLNLEG